MNGSHIYISTGGLLRDASVKSQAGMESTMSLFDTVPDANAKRQFAYVEGLG